MKASNIKGALLEYIVRNLLKSCGFTNVRADNVFSFERGGLFFINGKGAAHDADVIMNPPVQMPFAYPTQLLFECKAYDAVANLPIVRNALGLRNDLNDFEIVTRDTILSRQNNRRADYAIDTRARFLYQVGVASINGFSTPAVEFSANNKIPLLSLDWFFGHTAIDAINGIDQPLIDSFSNEDIQNVYDYFKDRNADLYDQKYLRANEFLKADNIIGDIVTSVNAIIRRAYVGLLETGDLFFLYSRSHPDSDIFSTINGLTILNAEIHWSSEAPNKWMLTVYNPLERNYRIEFDFYLPKRIFNIWKQYNLSKSTALNIKQEFFSKIFVFSKGYNPQSPFSIIYIDRAWLDELRNDDLD